MFVSFSLRKDLSPSYLYPSYFLLLVTFFVCPIKKAHDYYQWEMPIVLILSHYRQSKDAFDLCSQDYLNNKIISVES